MEAGAMTRQEIFFLFSSIAVLAFIVIKLAEFLAWLKKFHG